MFAFNVPGVRRTGPSSFMCSPAAHSAAVAALTARSYNFTSTRDDASGQVIVTAQLDKRAKCKRCSGLNTMHGIMSYNNRCQSCNWFTFEQIVSGSLVTLQLSPTEDVLNVLPMVRLQASSWDGSNGRLVMRGEFLPGQDGSQVITGIPAMQYMIANSDHWSEVYAEAPGFRRFIPQWEVTYFPDLGAIHDPRNGHVWVRNVTDSKLNFNEVVFVPGVGFVLRAQLHDHPDTIIVTVEQA